MHCIALTFLIIVSAQPNNESSLKSSMHDNLGTKYVFSTTSKAIAIIEAVAFTFLLPGYSVLAQMCLAIIHNLVVLVDGDLEMLSICIFSAMKSMIKNKLDSMRMECSL